MQYSTIDFQVEIPQPDQPFLFSADSLYAQLQHLEDQRKCRGRLYELAPILLIALLAKLMGQNQLGAVAHWAQLRAAQLGSLLGLKRTSMPHKTTWSRILGGAVDVKALEQLIGRFFNQQLAPAVAQRGSLVLNIDGKTLRGTIPHGQTRGVHLMAAYLPQQGIVLMQVAVDSKENEIVAAPKLLAEMDLRGMVVTGDAMQAQRKLSVQVVSQGGDYLWKVKDNQPDLLSDLQVLFEPEPVAAGCSPHPTDFEVARQWSKGHGRLEERVLTASSWLKDYTPWPHLEQAYKLERTVYNLAGERCLSREVSYGITSLGREVAGAGRLLKLVRAGWGIENQSHHRRDVQLREDHSQLRMGQAPQVNAILNNTLIGLLSLVGKKNVAAARRSMEYDPRLALDLLTKPLLSSF